MNQHALAIATLLLAAACGGKEPEPAAGAAAGPATPIPPAILAPDQTVDPVAQPSYEVSIAAAAAEHNAAKERCAAQPEAVRAQCEQEANAAYLEARQGLEDLRGNQQ